MLDVTTTAGTAFLSVLLFLGFMTCALVVMYVNRQRYKNLLPDLDKDNRITKRAFDMYDDIPPPPPLEEDEDGGIKITGPLSLLRPGDKVYVDRTTKMIKVDIPAAELEKRKLELKQAQTQARGGRPVSAPGRTLKKKKSMNPRVLSRRDTNEMLSIGDYYDDNTESLY